MPQGLVYFWDAAIGFAAWLATFARSLPRTARLPLAVALFGFGASAGIDMVWDVDSDWRLVLEDGTKFLGIWCWVVFAAIWSAVTLRPTLDRSIDSALGPAVDPRSDGPR